MTTLVGTGSSLFRPTEVNTSGEIAPGEYEIIQIQEQIDLELIDFEGGFKFTNADRSINAINRVRIIAPFNARLTDHTGSLLEERELIIDVPGLIVTITRPSRFPKDYYVTVAGILN